MDKAEFDSVAEEYRSLHKENIKASGEDVDFFAEYKIKDLAKLCEKNQLLDSLDVMDFGAGVGNSIPFFKEYLPYINLTCVDVSRKSLDLAEQRFPQMASYVEFDGQTLPYENNSFDVVFSACVFHHIPADKHELLLAELYRVLHPGGMLVIFEHNPYNPLTVRAVNTCSFDINAVLISSSTLIDRITRVGFSNVYCSYRIFFPHALSLLRKLEPYLKWLPLGAQYFTCARKVSDA